MDALKLTMIQALTRSIGVVTQACNIVNIPRSTHYNWMQNDDDYRKAVEDIQEVALDFVESNLFKQIAAGEQAATIFYLKTKGKKRGYIEPPRNEVINQVNTMIQNEPIDASKLSREQRRILADIQLQLGSGGSEG